MNKVQILDKLQRNLVMRGMSPVRGATTVTVANMVISCVDADIQSPMGGVSASSAPFLGIGVAAPSIIKIVGASSSYDTLAKIFVTEAAMVVFREVCGFANDIMIYDDDGSTLIATIRGSADLVGLGQ